jgi:hypothetical protein
VVSLPAPAWIISASQKPCALWLQAVLARPELEAGKLRVLLPTGAFCVLRPVCCVLLPMGACVCVFNSFKASRAGKGLGGLAGGVRANPGLRLVERASSSQTPQGRLSAVWWRSAAGRPVAVQAGAHGTAGLGGDAGTAHLTCCACKGRLIQSGLFPGMAYFQVNVRSQLP